MPHFLVEHVKPSKMDLPLLSPASLPPTSPSTMCSSHMEGPSLFLTCSQCTTCIFSLSSKPLLRPANHPSWNARPPLSLHHNIQGFDKPRGLNFMDVFLIFSLVSFITSCSDDRSSLCHDLGLNHTPPPPTHALYLFLNFLSKIQTWLGSFSQSPFSLPIVSASSLHGIFQSLFLHLSSESTASQRASTILHMLFLLVEPSSLLGKLILSLRIKLKLTTPMITSYKLQLRYSWWIH